MTFHAQPGTIQFRAMTWLQAQPAGTEVTASIWGEAINVDGTTLITCIKPAIEAGAVRRRTKDGMQRPLWFSLGNGTPPVRQEPEPPGDDPVPKVTEPTPTEKRKLIEKGPKAVAEFEAARRPMTLQECVDAEQKPAEPAPFDVWFSGVSGELVIQGAHVAADGDVVLPKEQVRQLLAALSGMAA